MLWLPPAAAGAAAVSSTATLCRRQICSFLSPLLCSCPPIPLSPPHARTAVIGTRFGVQWWRSTGQLTLTPAVVVVHWSHAPVTPASPTPRPSFTASWMHHADQLLLSAPLIQRLIMASEWRQIISHYLDSYIMIHRHDRFCKTCWRQNATAIMLSSTNYNRETFNTTDIE